MGLVLREALRRLCVEIGWSYAVFWRAVGGRDQMHLVWGEGYCEGTSGFEAPNLRSKEEEDRVQTLVYTTMVSQVHVLGNGIVGKAALTGQYEWVYNEILNDNASVTKGLAEMNQQFLAGIQTIAIIPVLPHGIVQVGSTQMIMENIGFVNYVKTLFEQLGCHPGALLLDITQKASSQEMQARVSLGMQNSVNQLGDVTDINSLFFHSGEISNHRSYPDSRSVTQPSCSISSQLFSAPEVQLTKQVNTSKMMPINSCSQTTSCPLVTAGLRCKSEIESGHLMEQVMFSNPDVRAIKDVSPHDSSSGSQYHPPVGLSSNSLSFLEEHVLSSSGIGARESTNNNEPILDNARLPQPRANEGTSSASLKNSYCNSSFGRSELPGSANDLGRFSLLPGGDAQSIKSQCVVSSGMKVPQVLHPVNHFNSSLMLSRDSERSRLTSIDKKSETVSSLQKQKKDSCLFQALDGTQNKFDNHSLFYKSLLETPQDDKGYEKSGLHALNEKTFLSPVMSTSGNDLFDMLGLDCKSGRTAASLDDVIVHINDTNTFELSNDVSTCTTQLHCGPIFDALNHEISCSGMFSEAGSDQLLDAVVSQVNSGVKPNTDDSVSCKISLTKISGSSLYASSPAYGSVALPGEMHGEIFGLSPALIKSEAAGSSSVKSACSLDKAEGCCSRRDVGYNSQISQWVEKGPNLDCVSTHCKRVDELGKSNRKRSRPGENPRPRPKDRQMIQDRVKELREIVPNGAKCSIDALLEKTIKHMLFLQSVTKHADKLKETGEPKIISKEGGLLLKDNFEGGATWAFEVGNQSMICPIVVEDLSSPRQMLVEMLCEEQGLFLEIADLIRGLGLTILKGVMEARNDKVWARFAVEANRDVTRMEIFLSLVRLLEPTLGSSKLTETAENSNKPHNMFCHPSSIPATGLSDCLW